MSYGITQSYLPPDRGSVSRPYPGRIGRYSIYPPIKDERLSRPLVSTVLYFANILRNLQTFCVLFCPVCLHSHHWCVLLPVMVWLRNTIQLLDVTRYALLSCKPFDWSFSDFTSGKLSLCNTNFGTFHNLSITHAQRQSGLFLCELGLLHLRDQATVLSNGMSLLRSEIDDLILYVCCT